MSKKEEFNPDYKLFNYLALHIEQDGTVTIQDAANGWKYYVSTFAKASDLAPELRRMADWLDSWPPKE